MSAQSLKVINVNLTAYLLCIFDIISVHLAINGVAQRYNSLSNEIYFIMVISLSDLVLIIFRNQVTDLSFMDGENL